ncbi:ankyrin repeat domain-containing protein [Rickettsiales endosymbiont of Peranema trichophorum]|uniref:ankyrin repeat domain-containing protein n=1 Tax=Rickettsiales endosymbiont of Peranema trichophorum TaxID=2486577 RepID=UPI0010233CC9|nr:ankyrin repeat domain-containing protein [Rickettsiales endosymbiont of Peranema trichophorum]RZI47379.1 ankyrin repeat domain-containing protein [Rickettsiales endosymbiont of Peranema trichophorum]
MQDEQQGQLFLSDVQANNVQGVIRYLDNGGDINFRSILGETALHCASETGHVTIYRLLLAHPDIDVNVLELFGSSPLHKAIYYQRLDIVELLIKHRADVNIIGEGYTTPTCTPLHFAADKDPDITLLLLEAGANVNALNCAGLPALDIAIDHRHKENCIILLQYGADPGLCRARLRDTKFFANVSQEAVGILDHNDRSILQMVSYKLALSRFCFPFEMIKEVCSYYESPYWWKKFDTKYIDTVMEIVLPTYAQKILDYLPGDTAMVEAGANSDGDEWVALSGRDGSSISDYEELQSTTNSYIDHNSTLVDEDRVLISSSEKHDTNVACSESDDQNTLPFNEVLRWISTLPIWLQVHMMRLHLVERLVGLSDASPTYTWVISGDAPGTCEADHTLTRYDTAPYIVENVSATDYVTEYQNQLGDLQIMDSAFYPVIIDWNSGITFPV